MAVQEVQGFSAEHLQFLISAGPAVLYVLKVEGDALIPAWISGNVERILGYDSKECLDNARWWLDGIHPDDRDAAVLEMSELLPTGTLIREYRFRRKDGNYLWLRDELRTVSDAAGKPVEIVGTWTDITERKLAEAARLESEEQIFSILENSPVSIILTAKEDDRIAFANAGFFEMFGLDEEVTLGAIAPELFADQGEHEALLKKFEEDGALRDVEARLKRGDGTLFWATVSMIPFEYQSRSARITWLYDITQRKSAEEKLREAHDDLDRRVRERTADLERTNETLRNEIAQRRQAQTALKESEQRFKDFAEASADWFWETDSELRFSYMSPNVERIAGLPPEWYYGKTRQDLRRGDHDQAAWQNHLETLNARKPFRDFVYLRDGGSGEPRWLRTSGTPIFGADGSFLGYRGSATDVTDTVHADRALRKAEELFRAMFEQAAVGIGLMTPGGRFLAANTRLCELLSLTPEELLAKNFEEITYPDDYRACTAGVARLVAGEISTFSKEIRYTSEDGEMLWGNLTISAIREPEDDRMSLLGIVEDVTERKRVETALRESEELFSKAFHSSPTLIAISNPRDGRLYDINDAWASTMGFTREEAIGKTVLELNVFVDPERRAEMIRVLERGGAVRGWEFQGRTKAGEIRDLLASIEKIELDQGTRLLFVSHDITERKRLEDQFRQALKMEAIGQLTGGIAHDFNNLMTVVQGNLELLKEDLGDDADDDVLELVNDALSASRDGSDLAHRLLVVSRKESLHPTRIDTNEMINDFSRMVRRTVGRDIEVKVELGGDVAALMADRNQLENALLNLCVNSSHAMPEGGGLRLATANKSIDRDGADDFPEVAAGDYVMVTVSDTGTGMAPEVLAQALEPFYTTKEAGKGTGLGLSMVYGFARQSGGGLKIASEVGKGAAVSLLLPAVASDALEPQQRDDDSEDLPGGSETVLLVEDEARIRRFAARCLKDLGYRVLEAENAAAALEVLEREAAVDLLFTDIVMPGDINGRELAKTATAAYPGLKVQLATGFSKGAGSATPDDDKIFPVLKKPYSQAQLARSFREVLDGDG